MQEWIFGAVLFMFIGLNTNKIGLHVAYCFVLHEIDLFEMNYFSTGTQSFPINIGSV